MPTPPPVFSFFDIFVELNIDGLVLTSPDNEPGRVVGEASDTNITSFRYNSNGLLIQIIDPIGNSITYEYDALRFSKAPEPTTFALMILGLVGIGYRQYKAT